MPLPAYTRAALGVNLFGYVSGDFGLAVASRNTIRALLARDLPVVLRDYDTRDGRSGHDETYSSLLAGSDVGLPYMVNLFHLNPPEILMGVPILWPRLNLGSRLNAIVPFWEIPALPESHIRAFRVMDFVLAPSLYIKQIVERNVPDARVRHFPQAVYQPPNVRPHRQRWELPDDAVVFICSFDLNSDVNRKNPWAAIESFRMAFPGGENVILVVKLHGVDAWHGHKPHVARLRSLARADHRIRLIEQRMGYDDTLSLYASCDALVYLHRAEGLGLVGMEMMSLGKPIVATAWSGNMDYCTADNSILVPYAFVAADPVIPAYTGRNWCAGARWADADVEYAARALRRLAEDPGLREKLGRQAAEDMDERRARHSAGEIVDLLREESGYVDHTASEFADRRKAILALRVDAARLAAQRLPSAASRRLRRLAWLAYHFAADRVLPIPGQPPDVPE